MGRVTTKLSDYFDSHRWGKDITNSRVMPISPKEQVTSSFKDLVGSPSRRDPYKTIQTM